MTLQINRRAPSGARTRPSRRIITLAALLFWSAAPATAVASLEAQVRECAAVADRESRLHCFDTLAAELVDGEAGKAVANTPPHVERQAEEAAEPTPTPAAAPAPLTKLTARIDRVDRQPRGERIFFLSNGEVWVELEAGRARYETGMTVTIERTTLGGYILSTDAGRATRVRRLQ